MNDSPIYLFPKSLEILDLDLQSLQTLHITSMHAMQEMTPIHKYHFTDSATHTNLVYNGCLEICDYIFNNPVPIIQELAISQDERTQKAFRDCLLLAGAFHDIGKAITWNPKGSPWFPKHEHASAQMLIDTTLFNDMFMPDPTAFGPDNAMTKNYDTRHPMVNVVDHHGWARNAESCGAKSATKFINKLTVSSLYAMDSIDATDAGSFVTLRPHDMIMLYACLLLADLQGFAKEGAIPARAQLHAFCAFADKEFSTFESHLFSPAEAPRKSFQSSINTIAVALLAMRKHRENCSIESAKLPADQQFDYVESVMIPHSRYWRMLLSSANKQFVAETNAEIMNEHRLVTENA